jgi:hypothetical protein
MISSSVKGNFGFRELKKNWEGKCQENWEVVEGKELAGLPRIF